MDKIATHNSVTGERGHGILSWLVAPFSMCQSKTLKEQYNAGCRYFDIRYRWSKRRKHFVCAHGLWEAKKTLQEVLDELRDIARGHNDRVYIMLTYEGECDVSTAFSVAHSLKEPYGYNISITYSYIKKPYWRLVDVFLPLHHKNHYKVLDGSSWHTYIPIPWLWKKLYYNTPKFNDDYFVFVDFL